MDKQASDGPQLSDAPDLVSDVLRHLRRLFEKEMQLAKTEVRTQLVTVGFGLLLIVLAILLVLTALQVFAAAAVGGLAAIGLPIWGASLITGGVLLVVAVVLILVGKARIAAQTLRPERSIALLRKDFQTLKEHAHAQ